MLPAIGNEFVVIVKESSIVSFIGVTEIMFQAGAVQGITYNGMLPFLIVAVMYFIVTFTLSRILGRFERRLQASDNR
ncbi:Arginine transport system permease protein ArtQ [compost metagenome]